MHDQRRFANGSVFDAGAGFVEAGAELAVEAVDGGFAAGFALAIGFCRLPATGN
jgi:hypothetical protein